MIQYILSRLFPVHLPKQFILIDDRFHEGRVERTLHWRERSLPVFGDRVGMTKEKIR